MSLNQGCLWCEARNVTRVSQRVWATLQEAINEMPREFSSFAAHFETF